MSIDAIGSGVAYGSLEYEEYEDYSSKQLSSRGNIGGKVSGSTNTDGNSGVKGEAYIEHETGKGGKFTGEVNGEVRRGSDGKLSGKAEVKAGWEMEYNPFYMRV